MAQNITLLGATYNDVPSVMLPKDGGGQAKFIDETAWSWLAVEPKLISAQGSHAMTLADTDYESWSASTTAHTLVATSNLSTFSADMVNKAYALRWRWQIEIGTLAGVTLKALPLWQCGEIWQIIFRRPNNLTNIVNNNFAGNAVVTSRNAPLMKYYNSSGSLTFTYSSSYGFYCAATAPTFSNSTSDSPTVTIKTPTVSCRCSSTYFATGRKTYIDTATKISYICDLFELPPQCMERQVHEGLVDLYNNPLSIPLPTTSEPEE